MSQTMASRHLDDPPLAPDKTSKKKSKKLRFRNVLQALKKYITFIGPGLVVSVAYMDPGNYLTLVLLGALYQYRLCVVILFSNIFAVILQVLCVKLGTVTGLDLAEMCRMHLPPYLNLLLYVCAELAIIATDLAEVVGTAIALEILFGIPLVYGVLITIVDVLVVLIAYQRDGGIRKTRVFEFLVLVLVVATCACFILELFKCDFAPGSMAHIFKGFLPVYDKVWREQQALFLSCGIVGSTVMPHSLFLGSALVQPRLMEFDEANPCLNNSTETVLRELDRIEPQVRRATGALNNFMLSMSDGSTLRTKYKPSIDAIRYCLNFSYVELVFSLFVVAVFVNSAILIVAGTTLYGKPDAADADLLSIYHMLSAYISPAAGIVFALSMLFSGQSAGIVCTMAGQIVSEGFVNWTILPWKRRLATRSLAIVPVLAVILILGREGMSRILNSLQVVLSFILPVVSAPLIYFTCSKKHMTVIDLLTHKHAASPIDETSSLLHGRADLSESAESMTTHVTFENGFFLRHVGAVTWILISSLNFYLLYAFAHGAEI